MRRCVFCSANERSEGEGKGKEEEGRKQKGKGEMEREIGSEALAETEKIANAPAGNRTQDPFLSLPLPFPYPLPPTFRLHSSSHYQQVDHHFKKRSFWCFLQMCAKMQGTLVKMEAHVTMEMLVLSVHAPLGTQESTAHKVSTCMQFYSRQWGMNIEEDICTPVSCATAISIGYPLRWRSDTWRTYRGVAEVRSPGIRPTTEDDTRHNAPGLVENTHLKTLGP